MKKKQIKKLKPKASTEEHGFITLTYGIRVDPEVLTDELVEKIENRDVDFDELCALGELTFYEGIAWTQ